MYFYLSVLPSLKHKIILLLNHRCVEFISIKLPTMSKSNQKLWKTRNYPCTWKSYSTSRTGIGGHKKKEVIINSKTSTLSYFDKWKKKQQDQGGKYFYFLFISQLWLIDYSTISNLIELFYSCLFEKYNTLKINGETIGYKIKVQVLKYTSSMKPGKWSSYM